MYHVQHQEEGRLDCDCLVPMECKATLNMSNIVHYLHGLNSGCWMSKKDLVGCNQFCYCVVTVE